MSVIHSTTSSQRIILGTDWDVEIYGPPVFDADHFPKETKGISISLGQS